MDTITVKPSKIGYAVAAGTVLVVGAGSYLLYKRWVKKHTIVVPAESKIIGFVSSISQEPNGIVVTGVILDKGTLDILGGSDMSETSTKVNSDIIEMDGVQVTREILDLAKEDPEIQAALREEAESQRPARYEDITPIRTNVFARTMEGDWDYDQELLRRSQNPGEPYVLHQDEFAENQSDFRQSTVAYYEGDDTMVDDITMQPIYNHAGLMGELNFGYGTNDPNAVYIRNETQEHEWEVLRHTGSYANEVLGLHADEEVEHELRHSAISRFRRE